MRIQLLSDLHLETHAEVPIQPAPGAEVLVLAGDIGSYQTGSRLTEPDFGLSRFSPLRPGSPWRKVFFVPGNHEYDGLDFDTTHTRLQALCAELGIVWLERAVHVDGDVRFVGTTLWSDFDALAEPGDDTTHLLRKRDKAFRAANFYLRKNSTLQSGVPMLAEDLRELGLRCQSWLRLALDAPFEGRTVVVSHFAPSLFSADPRYGLTPGTAGFCNSLDDLLGQADLWMHGHLHCPADYTVRSPTGRACRVVANPLGYARKGEQAGFRLAWSVSLPGAGREPVAPVTGTCLS